MGPSHADPHTARLLLLWQLDPPAECVCVWGGMHDDAGRHWDLDTCMHSSQEGTIFSAAEDRRSAPLRPPHNPAGVAAGRLQAIDVHLAQFLRLLPPAGKWSDLPFCPSPQPFPALSSPNPAAQLQFAVSWHLALLTLHPNPILSRKSLPRQKVAGLGCPIRSLTPRTSHPSHHPTTWPLWRVPP